jgi:hypothetical protein
VQKAWWAARVWAGLQRVLRGRARRVLVRAGVCVRAGVGLRVLGCCHHDACGPMTCVPRGRPSLQPASGAAGLTGARGCGGQRFAVLCGLGLASAASAFAPAPVAAPRLRGTVQLTHLHARGSARCLCLSTATA